MLATNTVTTTFGEIRTKKMGEALRASSSFLFVGSLKIVLIQFAASFSFHNQYCICTFCKSLHTINYVFSFSQHEMLWHRCFQFFHDQIDTRYSKNENEQFCPETTVYKSTIQFVDVTVMFNADFLESTFEKFGEIALLFLKTSQNDEITASI